MFQDKIAKPKVSELNKKTSKLYAERKKVSYSNQFLKTGIEGLSGISIDDVTAPCNFSQPAHLQALGYTQGTNAYVAPNQKKYLPHKALHVVQQRQDRVKPPMQMKVVSVNGNRDLEHEADEMEIPDTQYNINNPVQFKNANCMCIQRIKLGNGQFAFMTNAGAITRPKIRLKQIQNDDIFSVDKYDITDLRRKVPKTTLQRDHIIPYQMIMKFANEVCNFNGNGKDTIDEKRKDWFKRGVLKMKAFGYKGDYYNVGDKGKPLSAYDISDEFTAEKIMDSIEENDFTSPIDRNKFEVIHKAISWMPGNIMIAPNLKADDSHDGNVFDNTCKNIIPDMNYKILYRAFINMKSFLNNKQNKDAEAALDDLSTIITWDGPYAFKPEQWLYDEKAKCWRNSPQNEDASNDELHKALDNATLSISLLQSILDKRTLDHVSKKKYPSLVSNIKKIEQDFQLSDETVQKYYNLPISFYIEPYFKKLTERWDSIHERIEKELLRTAPKYRNAK